MADNPLSLLLEVKDLARRKKLDKEIRDRLAQVERLIESSSSAAQEQVASLRAEVDRMRALDPVTARMQQIEASNRSLTTRLDEFTKTFEGMRSIISNKNLNTELALGLNSERVGSLETQIASLGTLEGSLIRDFYIDVDKQQEAYAVVVTNRGKVFRARLPRYKSTKAVGISRSEFDTLQDKYINGLRFQLSSITTNGSGQATVEIDPPPTIAVCVAASAERVAHVTNIAGSTLTITVRKLIYDKANDPAATSAQNAPSGVTVASTSGQTTANTTATNQATTATNQATTATNQNTTLNGNAQAVDAVGGAGNALRVGLAHTHTQDSHNHTQDSHNHTQNAHNHVMNILYQHGHALTHTATSLALATSETLNILIVHNGEVPP